MNIAIANHVYMGQQAMIQRVHRCQLPPVMWIVRVHQCLHRAQQQHQCYMSIEFDRHDLQLALVKIIREMIILNQFLLMIKMQLIQRTVELKMMMYIHCHVNQHVLVIHRPCITYFHQVRTYHHQIYQANQVVHQILPVSQHPQLLQLQRPDDQEDQHPLPV